MINIHPALRVFYASDVGTRDNNEDNFLIPHKRPHILKKNESGEKVVEIPKPGRVATFALSDGMGGENNGEAASFCVIRTLNKIPAGIHRATAINEKVLDLQKRYRGKCGATLVSCQFRTDGQSVIAYIESIGDSPCFLIRDGHVKKVTRDDNVYQELLEAGSLPESDEEIAYAKSGLTNFFGKKGSLEMQKHILLCEPGDVFVLCSDGVVLEENDEAYFLHHENPALALVNTSVEENKYSHSISDNTTAIIIELEVKKHEKKE